MRLENSLAALVIFTTSASPPLEASGAQQAAMSVSATLAQDVAPSPSTGIADCDEYYAMVSACLSRMCETERALVELELSFSRETLSKVIELKGREAAAEACVQDILKEIQNDPYGCYDSQRAKAGLPTARIRDIRIEPTASSVTISFKSEPATAGDRPWEVAIVPGLEAGVSYQVLSSDNVFVLDTAVERPIAGGEQAGGAPTGTPIVGLDAGMSYCFAIKSPTGEERRGTFTTSVEH
jgi:hypothetical protein